MTTFENILAEQLRHTLLCSPITLTLNDISFRHLHGLHRFWVRVDNSGPIGARPGALHAWSICNSSVSCIRSEYGWRVGVRPSLSGQQSMSFPKLYASSVWARAYSVYLS